MKTITILVPVDFTQVSKNAINYAIGLSQQVKAKIIFVHAYTVAYLSGTPIGMATMAHEMAGTSISQEKFNKDRLRDFLGNFPQLENLEHISKVSLGATVDVICQTAKDENANIIIMGTEGADSTLEEFFIGTVSEKVSRNAPCSVLIIPKDAKFKEFGHFGFAIDTDSVETDANLDTLSNLLQRYDARLHFVHISGRNEVALDEATVHKRFSKFLTGRKFSFTILENEEPEKSINHYLSENPIDVLALLFRKHNFFERMLENGLRKKLVFGSKIPVLIIK